MSLLSYATQIKAISQPKRWAPRGEVLQSDIPADATPSVDRDDPQVFGPLYMRPKEEMVISDVDAEIISKEYVDDFSAGVGQLSQAIRQPYLLNAWYSSSHAWRRVGRTWADGECRMSAMFLGFAATFDALRLEVQTGAVGSEASVGIYALDDDLLPYELIADGGTVLTDSAAKVTATLSTPLTVISATWLGLAVSVSGGTPALWCDTSSSATSMPQPYGWAALDFGNAANAKYSLLVTGTSGALPAPSSFDPSSTSPFGSGLWVRRSA